VDDDDDVLSKGLFAGGEAHKTLANPLEPNRALYLSLLQQGGEGTYKNKNNT
jgi:hypothetical protein